MKLFEAVAAYRADLDALAALDLDPVTAADTLDSIQGDLQDKLRAVIAYSLEVEITATGAAAAAKRMKDRADSLDTRVKWLRDYALRAMQATGLGEVGTDEFDAKIAKTPPKVVIADDAVIPLAYWRQPEPHPATVDKKALSDAIKGGAVIPGVSLAGGFRLALR